MRCLNVRELISINDLPVKPIVTLETVAAAKLKTANNKLIAAATKAATAARKAAKGAPVAAPPTVLAVPTAPNTSIGTPGDVTFTLEDIMQANHQPYRFVRDIPEEDNGDVDDNDMIEDIPLLPPTPPTPPPPVALNRRGIPFDTHCQCINCYDTRNESTAIDKWNTKLCLGGCMHLSLTCWGRGNKCYNHLCRHI